VRHDAANLSGIPSGTHCHEQQLPTEEHSVIFESYAKKVSPVEIEGYVKQSNQYAGKYTVFYWMELSKPCKSMDAWVSDEKAPIETLMVRNGGKRER